MTKLDEERDTTMAQYTSDAFLFTYLELECTSYMRNETSSELVLYAAFNFTSSSLSAKDIRDNLFPGLFIEGVECLSAAVTGCLWRARP